MEKKSCWGVHFLFFCILHVYILFINVLIVQNNDFHCDIFICAHKGIYRIHRHSPLLYCLVFLQNKTEIMHLFVFSKNMIHPQHSEIINAATLLATLSYLA
jgi:hypothetical protein